MLWIDWKTWEHENMRAPKTFEGGLHPPHTSPHLTTRTETKRGLLSKISNVKPKLLLCFTITLGVLRSFSFTVRTWKACSGRGSPQRKIIQLLQSQMSWSKGLVTSIHPRCRSCWYRGRGCCRQCDLWVAASDCALLPSWFHALNESPSILMIIWI